MEIYIQEPSKTVSNMEKELNSMGMETIIKDNS